MPIDGWQGPGPFNPRITGPSLVYQDADNGALVGADGGPLSLGSAGLSAVSYDGSNRAIGFTIGSVDYTVAYSSSSITVTGSNGSSAVISLDGSGRINGVT